MCGINGYIRPSSTSKAAATIAAMNASIAHRGPDFAGVFEDDAIVLGHLLLAIREAATLSHQPYTKEGSPWVLLLNGQIYNTQQLKKELSAEYQNVDLDTAVLYGTIEKYGWDFIGRVQGMFAIALYNKEEKTVRLYRDPSGQKVLYYYAKDGAFVFSSELRGILAYGDIDRSVDAEAVAIAASLGYIPGTKTVFKYISKLNASEVVSYDCTKKTFARETYASLPKHYYGASFDEALTMLVLEHLQSKQNVALNLSGGLDSSALLHVMSKSGFPVSSYTTRFDTKEEKYNRDADLAARLAADYGAKHHEILVTKDDYIASFIETCQTIEEPNYNISNPVYALTAKREGRRGDNNRVVLSGDGGDELFGGYPHYLRNVRDDALARRYSAPLFNLMRNMRNGTKGLHFEDPSDRWYFYKYFRPNFLLHAPGARVVPQYVQDMSREFLKNYSVKNSSIYGTMLMDRITWLAGENFIRSDKLYMHESLEMRNPLSYHPFRIYVDSLLGENDYINERSNKIYLRKWAQSALPSYITHRQDKTGWRAPVSLWYDAKLKELFLSIVAQAQKNGGSYIAWEEVRKAVEQTDAWPGKHIHFYVSLAALSNGLGLGL